MRIKGLFEEFTIELTQFLRLWEFPCHLLGALKLLAREKNLTHSLKLRLKHHLIKGCIMSKTAWAPLNQLIYCLSILSCESGLGFQILIGKAVHWVSLQVNRPLRLKFSIQTIDWLTFTMLTHDADWNNFKIEIRVYRSDPYVGLVIDEVLGLALDYLLFSKFSKLLSLSFSILFRFYSPILGPNGSITGRVMLFGLVIQ